MRGRALFRGRGSVMRLMLMEGLGRRRRRRGRDFHLIVLVAVGRCLLCGMSVKVCPPTSVPGPDISNWSATALSSQLQARGSHAIPFSPTLRTSSALTVLFSLPPLQTLALRTASAKFHFHEPFFLPQLTIKWPPQLRRPQPIVRRRHFYQVIL